MVRYVDLVSDTICSPITAPGHAGVAIVRVCGDKALEYVNRISNLGTIKSHTCKLVKVFGSNQNEVDQCLMTFFEKGKSFTGDQTVEIACHGNPLIVNQIIDLLLDQGCRSAERGEFSFRAFYNGNLDLIQAESIQSLVMSGHQMGSSQFIGHLSGSLSEKFRFLEEGLISVLGHIEANIDFVEEDIEPDEYTKIHEKLKDLELQNQKLLITFDVGKNLEKSFKILLLGKTNAGKSSLFNALVESDRSIITDIEGTTRDIVSEKVFINNFLVEFLDSAGLRQAQDLVEKIGIEKTLDQLDHADLILYVIDGLSEIEIPKDFLERKNLVPIVNKRDRLGPSELANVKNLFNDSINLATVSDRVRFVSAKTGEGIAELRSMIENQIISQNTSIEKDVITQARHFDHLKALDHHISSAIELVESQESPDLISQELQLGLSELHGLLGKEYNDEILDKIFSDFCIGK